MKKLLLTIIGSAFTAFAANAIGLGDRLLLTARLTGDQEVPAVVTNAQGVGSFLLNNVQDSLCVSVTVTGLSGAITGVNIYNGAPGVTGTTVITNLSTFVSGNTVKTIIYGNALAAHLKEYLSGQLYINIHTIANPTGEIRGQIKLETDWNFVSTLDGGQVVPATSTIAYGLGVFTLSKDSSKLKYAVVLQGLSGVLNGARLNYGAFGKNGALALDLTSSIIGNSIVGVVTNPTPALIDSLTKSKVYLDLSTAAHPAGTELRGQLINESKYLYFSAPMNGQQEVPAVVTAGVGIGSIKVNTTLDTLWYDIVNNGLSGAITGAHFHLGAPGVSGGVQIDILSSVVGTRLTGVVVGAQLNKTFIGQLLRGNLYLNLHTALNPNGEIRGQIYRAARQGFTINLNGDQETPPVTSGAKGTGIVSIDAFNESAHYMIVVDGLTPTAAHFHKQVAGQSGGVIYDLQASLKNNGAFGYWRSTDSSPFTPAIANAFHADSVYANVHTAANLNGEIRGQVIQRGECFKDIQTGISDNKQPAANNLVLYPNPSSDVLNVAFNAYAASKVSFEIIDVLGKQIYTENFTAQAGNNLHIITVSNLKNGLYFIKIVNEKSQTIERFIKN